MDLLPFQQFTINNDDEIVSTISEFDLRHLEPEQRRIVLQQYTSLNINICFLTKKET